MCSILRCSLTLQKYNSLAQNLYQNGCYNMMIELSGIHMYFYVVLVSRSPARATRSFSIEIVGIFSYQTSLHSAQFSDFSLLLVHTAKLSDSHTAKFHSNRLLRIFYISFTLTPFHTSRGLQLHTARIPRFHRAKGDPPDNNTRFLHNHGFLLPNFHNKGKIKKRLL